MQAGNLNPNDKIIKSLKALPKVTLSTDQKKAQFAVIASTVAAGIVIMKDFSLYHLLLDRIKEELAKYLVLSMLVGTFFLAGTIGYVVYPYMKSKPPLQEKPALTPKKPEKQKKTKSKLPFENSNDVQETEAQEDTASGQTDESDSQINSGRRPSSNRATTEPESPSPAGETDEPADTTPPQVDYAPDCELKLLSAPPLLAGIPVKFEAIFSDPDGKIVKAIWDFGDGHVLEHGPDFSIIQHIYSTSGTYEVTLTVFDDTGNSTAFSETITITEGNQAPIAIFSDNTPKNAGELVTFYDQSYDPDGFIVAFHWNFGDGQTSIEKDPTHVFKVGGTYMVILTVTDDQGGTGQISKVLTIAAAINVAPIARFTAPNRHPLNQQVKFQNHSYDPDGFIVEVIWKFGDGGTDIVQSPEHTYEAYGDYEVTLTVIDDQGTSSSFTQTITIF